MAHKMLQIYNNTEILAFVSVWTELAIHSTGRITRGLACSLSQNVKPVLNMQNEMGKSNIKQQGATTVTQTCRPSLPSLISTWGYDLYGSSHAFGHRHVHINTTFSQRIGVCMSKQCVKKLDSVEERENKQEKKVKVRRGPLRKKKLSRKVQVSMLQNYRYGVGTWLMVKTKRTS